VFILWTLIWDSNQQGKDSDLAHIRLSRARGKPLIDPPVYEATSILSEPFISGNNLFLTLKLKL